MDVTKVYVTRVNTRVHVDARLQTARRTTLVNGLDRIRLGQPRATTDAPTQLSVVGRTVQFMDVAYSLGGVPYKVDSGHIWNRHGFYVGHITEDGLIFSPDGNYLGEFRDEDRIGFKHSHASKRRGARSPRSNRSGTSRGDRSARTIPSG